MSESFESGDEPEERLLGVKRGVKKSSWVEPMYASQPDILWDRKTVVGREWFVEKYKLHNHGITPKQIKIGQHLEEADVESLFGPRQNGNGYKYSQCAEDFVMRVESMWMICHQKTVVPNTRMVNVSEAKGWAYEIVKKRETNWALFAEWTCRDQLKKIRAEEEESRLGKLGHLKAEKEFGKECHAGKDNSAPDLPRDPTVPGGSSLARLSTFRTLAQEKKFSMAIGEWQDCLSALERESQGLDDYVQQLWVLKDEARMTFHKVSSQEEYGKKLIEDAEGRLADLEADYNKIKTSSEDVQLVIQLEESVGLEYIDENPLAKDLDECQRKVDAQKGILKVFHETFGGWESAAVERLNMTLADEAWAYAKKRQELWMRHRAAYQMQLRGMKACYERPGTLPSPSPLIYLDYKSGNVDTQVVEIGVCPFCLRGFEPVWDCCLVSCRHAYHSWCAVTHFSNSPTCIDENCGQDMHDDWWVSAGVAKPQIGKDGLVVAPAWERAPLLSKFNLFLLVDVVL